jgi:hypothetical protein
MTSMIADFVNVSLASLGPFLSMLIGFDAIITGKILAIFNHKKLLSYF